MAGNGMAYAAMPSLLPSAEYRSLPFRLQLCQSPAVIAQQGAGLFCQILLSGIIDRDGIIEGLELVKEIREDNLSESRVLLFGIGYPNLCGLLFAIYTKLHLMSPLFVA